MEQVRMGVIGVGNMGSSHVKRIVGGKVNGMVLTAVCDIAQERLDAVVQAVPDVEAFTDYRALIRSGLCDAVLIATPHYVHPEIAIDAFQQGLHVLTEKPAGVYTAQVEKMNAAAKKSGKVFGIMYNQRTSPVFAAAREIVQSGRLGALKRVNWLVTNWYRTQAYFDSGSWRATWAGEGGGVLINQSVHNIDIWQWIVGMPKTIRGFAAYGKYHNIEVEDDVTAYVEYDNGATGLFITTTGEYPGTNRLEIAGDRGKLVVEGGTVKFWESAVSERAYCFEATTESKKPALTLHEPDVSAKSADHTGICQNFADAILHGTPLLAPGEEGIRALTIINAIYLSDWTGEAVTLPFDHAKYRDMLLEKAGHSHLRDVQDRVETDSDEALTDRWAIKW